MTNPKTEPRTASGRAEHNRRHRLAHESRCPGLADCRFLSAILAIEAEAAEQSVPLDVEALTEAVEWQDPSIPDPKAFAEGVAAQFARLVDGAQATLQPAEPLDDSSHEDFDPNPKLGRRWCIHGIRDDANCLLCPDFALSARPAAHPAGSAEEERS